MKSFKNTSKFSKVLLILAIDFGLKLFFSCTPTAPMDINYNRINVTGIDNSGEYLNDNTPTDTMYASAVALKITLSDSTMFYTANFSPKILQDLFSFHSAYATSIETSYNPVNKVENIRIKTLLDINNNINAGDDITDHFLYAPDSFGLYQDLSQGIAKFNALQYSTSSSIVIVLKETIQNTNAKFEIKVNLDNGDELQFITELFSIIEP